MKRVLFVCVENSNRSQLAEALWRAAAGDRYEVASAGTAPKGVHPLTLRVLQEKGVPTAGLRSKHVSEFTGQPFDLVVTVCDHARETCPIWPGHPTSAHWGIPDPAAASEEERPEAFWDAYCALQRRIGLLLALPLESIDELSLRSSLQQIGATADAG